VAKSFKLKSPQVSLNAPNVRFKRFMTYTKVIPWDWSVHKMFTDAVPRDARHLVFNCHGYAQRPEFKAPHLSLGTVIHPGNVHAFEMLYSIATLKVIWISSCTVASSNDGLNFCMSMAIYSGCYVVSQLYAAPDVALDSGHTDDNKDSSPVYIDPYGYLIARKDFLDMGDDLGFAHV